MPQNIDASKQQYLGYLGFPSSLKSHFNLDPDRLTQISLEKGMGKLTDNGTLAINTGAFTGRSPKDRYLVKDQVTAEHVWWGDVNIPFDSGKFQALKKKLIAYLSDKEVYVSDAHACAHPKYTLNVRVVAELSWSSLFAYNMFLRPDGKDLEKFKADWHVICAPGFKADPALDGTRQENFAIVDFSEKPSL